MDSRITILNKRNMPVFIVSNQVHLNLITCSNRILLYDFPIKVVGSVKYPFFEKCFKNKLLNIFSNSFFYLKVQSFRLIMEYNFIQIAASAGHAVAYTISLIFKHIIDCVQLYFTNGFMNIVL